MIQIEWSLTVSEFFSLCNLRCTNKKHSKHLVFNQSLKVSILPSPAWPQHWIEVNKCNEYSTLYSTVLLTVRLRLTIIGQYQWNSVFFFSYSASLLPDECWIFLCYSKDRNMLKSPKWIFFGEFFAFHSFCLHTHTHTHSQF